jgi:cell division protein FtsB
METTSSACRKYDLGYETVSRLIERFDSGKLTGKPDSETLALKAENERLKAKVGELTMHIDLLNSRP